MIDSLDNISQFWYLLLQKFSDDILLSEHRVEVDLINKNVIYSVLGQQHIVLKIWGH